MPKDTENNVKENINYKKLYEKEVENSKVLQLKLDEYEKIMKSLAEKASQAHNDLQSATLEYNTRIKYMLDCARHSYMSMQFAVQATNKAKEDN